MKGFARCVCTVFLSFLQIFVDDTRMHAQTRVQDGTLEIHDSAMGSTVRGVGANVTELISLKSESSMRWRGARYDAGSNIDSRSSLILFPAANELQVPTGSRPLSSRPSADGEEVGQHDGGDVQSKDEHEGGTLHGKYGRGWWFGEFQNSEVQDRYLRQVEFQRVPELVAGLWLQSVIIVAHFSSLLALGRFQSPDADAARAQAAILGYFLPLLATSSLAFALALAKWFVEKQSMRGVTEDGRCVDGVVGNRQVHEGGSYKFPVSSQGLQRLLVLIKIAYAGCSMGFGSVFKENAWSLFYLMFAEAAHAFYNGLTARCTMRRCVC